MAWEGLAMGRVTGAGWRREFLRALRRTANVRVSAAQAGVDAGTAYNHRNKDAGFAKQWARAKAAGERAVAKAAAAAKAKAEAEAQARGDGGAGGTGGGGAGPAGRGSTEGAGLGDGMVVRRSANHGLQIVRAGEGRFSEEIGNVFKARLRATGCVRRAAAAAGISTTALYKRRDNYPDFAAEWAAAEADAKAQLHGFVMAAGIAAFAPDVEAEESAPKVTVSEAIAILRLKGGGPSPAAVAAAAAAARAAAGNVGLMPIEEVRAEVVRQVAALQKREERDGARAESAERAGAESARAEGGGGAGSGGAGA